MIKANLRVDLRLKVPWQGCGAEVLVVEGECGHLVGAGPGHRELFELVMLDQSEYTQQLACQEKT